MAPGNGLTRTGLPETARAVESREEHGKEPNESNRRIKVSAEQKELRQTGKSTRGNCE